MQRRMLLAAGALICLLAAMPAAAETIDVTGTNGVAGVAGADGDPGQDGAPGSDGASAESVADAPGQDNTATARGGRGGRGGNGGDGVPAGADGGASGSGGDGGDALARALVTGASSAVATATGGDGGVPGTPGAASDPGVVGSAGAEGTGGSATAEAQLSADQASPVTVQASAQGGRLGGAASADANAVNDGAGAVSATATATASGGSADSTAVAYGSNAGASPVTVRAEASSGHAFGGSPTFGEVLATAEGHSAGGGDVTVEAVAQRFDLFGATVGLPITELHDAVSGSTSGLLTLRQYVNPSSTFGAGGGYGGDAATSLTASNPGGGALALDVVLTGGDGSDAILGDVVGTSTSGADVTIDVRAYSGPFGGLVLHDDAARIHGESNGGAVTVNALFDIAVESPGSPDGGSIEMIDVVSGDTTGALSLTQFANAGAGSISYLGPAGSGGDAVSELTHETASSSLALFSRALGGLASPVEGSPPGIHGGSVRARAEGANSAGEARVRAQASGGDGASGGGDAVAEAIASTIGDGHAVVVGQDTGFSPAFAAVGGNSRFAYGGTGDSANGGTATSSSIGSATGDSPVTVYDSASGGWAATGGVRSSRFGPFIPTQGSGGNGGDAFSSATASGAGSSAVLAKARAYGGRAGVLFTDPGRAGDSSAQAHAEGLGEATAWSIARTEWDFTFGAEAGTALARADAAGASGAARAEALVGNPSLATTSLRAQSEALVTGHRRETAAAATAGGALADAPSDPDLHGSAFLTGAPLQSDLDAALADNDALAAVFSADPSAKALALGRWQGQGDGNGPLVLTTELQVGVTEDTGSRELFLAAFGTSVLGDGFESLSFSLERNRQPFGESHQFDTVESLLAFFADSLFELGNGWRRGDNVVARFELTADGASGAAMGFAFVQAVPEPETGVLVVLGIAVLARRRRAADFTRRS